MFFNDQRTIPLGHPPNCSDEDNSCQSILLFFRRISPHFPFIRQIVKLIYSIRAELKKIRHLTVALQIGNLDEMELICSHIELKSSSFLIESTPLNHESEIMTHYNWAFEAFRKIDSDWPDNVCYSCHKLCKKKDSLVISKVLDKDNKQFDELQKFYDENSAAYRHETDRICNYCLQKFRSNHVPPTCVIN